MAARSRNMSLSLIIAVVKLRGGALYQEHAAGGPLYQEHAAGGALYQKHAVAHCIRSTLLVAHCIRSTLLVAQLVEALCYKPEGRGFYSRCCHWKFFILPAALWAWGLTEMSTRNISWRVKAAGA